MSRFSHYGSGQRAAFAMMCVGFALCLIGAVVPFWLRLEYSVSDFTFGVEKEVPVLGNLLHEFGQNIKALKINLGVWVFCIEYIGSETKCYKMYADDVVKGNNDYDSYDGNSWIQIVRLAIAVNIKLSLICGLIACCRCLCCSGGRTICHGIFAFLAGGFGLVAVAVMAARKNDLVFGISDMEYDWAFYLYASGSGMMILASLFLCFAVPKENPSGVVLMHGAAPYLTVTTTNANHQVNQVNQYELNGQIQSFEPLPDQTVFQNPAPPQY